MDLILGCLIWFFLIYGIVHFVKSRKNKHQNNKPRSDEYSYDEAVGLDPASQSDPHSQSDVENGDYEYNEAVRPSVVDGGWLHAQNLTGNSDDGYGDGPISVPVEVRMIPSGGGLDNIIDEIKYANQDKDKRRLRAISIGNYLNSHAFGEGFYKLDMIGHEKLNNARKSMNIPAQDVVLAIMDDTAFGSAKEGIALCVDGIYWKTSFEASSYISWEVAKDLYDKGIIKFKNSKIDFGGKSKISLFMTQFTKSDALSSIEGILKSI
jgi:hypothetical protein